MVRLWLVGTLRKPSLFAASCSGGLGYIMAELCRVALMLFLAKQRYAPEWGKGLAPNSGRRRRRRGGAGGGEVR